MSFSIRRIYLPDRTLGSFCRDEEIIAKSLELPWLENKRAISCIPEGNYRVTKEQPIPVNDPKGRKERWYWHFRLHEVPGRSGILIHRGQHPKNSQGCILVGSRFADIGTIAPFVEGSGIKLQWLVDNLPDEFSLIVAKKVVTLPV